MSSHADETKTGIEATEPNRPHHLLRPRTFPTRNFSRPCRPVQGLQRHHAHQDSLCPHGRELCVADIAEATATSQSAVSHQLRTLKQSHLVSSAATAATFSTRSLTIMSIPCSTRA